MKMQSGMPRFLQHKTVWVLCFALAVSLLCLRQTMPASAQNSVTACGVVQSYTAATALAAGSLTLSPGGTLTLLPGTVINGDAQLVPGANVCVTITGLNGSVGAGITTSINVCGRLDALSNTSVTIAGQTFPIAAGTQLSGVNGVTVGSNVCLNATANALGQITSGGLVANVGANINVCGRVDAVSPTSITIAGQTFAIAAGAQLNGGNLLTVGNDVCLNATTNLAGQITGGGVTSNVGAGISICGVINAISSNSITIAGQTFAIAPGAQLSGGPLLATGNNVCLNATTNLAGQITGGGVTANVGANISICGVLGSISSSSITIGGQTFPIAAGTQLSGQNLLNVGADLCLNATTNVAGQITGGGVTLNVTGSVNVCGIVNALSSTGITVGSQVFTIATGTNVSGSATVGQCVCISAGTNTLGQISGTLTISPSNTCAQPTPTPTPTPGVTPTPTPTPGVTPTPTPTPGVTPTPTPTPGVTPTPTPTPGTTPTPTPTPGVTPTPTPTPGTTPTPTPTPGVTPTPTPTPGTTPTPTPTPGTTPTPTPGGGGSGPTPNPNCGAAQVIVPASTFGFTTTNNLPQGDLFLLSQRLFFTATTQPTDGLSIFPVTLASFGGMSFDLGGFRGVDLSGIALSAPGTTFRAVTCTDSLRDISFVLSATAGTSGDRIRLFTQDAEGRNTRFLVGFTIDNGVARVTEIDPAVQLYLNSRLGVAANAIGLNGLIPLGLAAGTNGNRSGLLTLRLSQAAFTDCVRLGLEMVRGSSTGQAGIVFTDVTVNRVEVAGDRANTSAGLLGGGTGGFPSGARCQSVCPACVTRCNVICLSSPQFFLLNPIQLPRGAVFIGGVNFNNPIIVQSNVALIQNFLQRDDSALDRLNQEYLALQLSILAAGGSLPTATQLRSPLSCYGASGITPLTLSNGVVLTLNSSLADLLAQAALAARSGQPADQDALARLLDLINGNEPYRRCARSTATQ